MKFKEKLDVISRVLVVVFLVLICVAAFKTMIGAIPDKNVENFNFFLRKEKNGEIYFDTKIADNLPTCQPEMAPDGHLLHGRSLEK